jgi:Zn-dependent M16 (insulinase) family peptidase
MGSEKYPYKGIIDHLANRGFSNGTNAWTDTDHTAYTVSTAGEQGFLQILPIYVDHVLYPTITKASFMTEVSSQWHLCLALFDDNYRFITLLVKVVILV